MSDDWDAVSSPVEKDATWDAVSTPQSKPQVKERAHIEMPVLKKTALFLGVFLVLALSGGGVFWAVNSHVIHFPAIGNTTATATAVLSPTTISPTSTPTPVGIGAPSGYWKLNDGNTDVAADISGNHLDGAINGASWSANHAPVPEFNYSLSFNGNGDLVSIPDSSELDFSSTDPMTISLWFDLSTLPNIWHAIGKRSGCSLTSLNYQLAFDASHGLLFDSGGDIVATGITSLQTGEWMQFGATYNPTSHILAVFLNGQEVIEKPNYVLSGENSAPLLIAESGTCGYTFPGNINEVCMWRQTLSESQMADLAQGTPC